MRGCCRGGGGGLYVGTGGPSSAGKRCRRSKVATCHQNKYMDEDGILACTGQQVLSSSRNCVQAVHATGIVPQMLTIAHSFFVH